MQKTVVIDVDIPQLANNLYFNRTAAAKVSHTILPWCYLAEEAAKEGIRMITGDVFLANPSAYPGALLISHMITPHTNALIAAGALPLILISQESPLIAFRFFFDLKKHSARYPHTYMPRGFKNAVAESTQFHAMYFVEPYSVGTVIPAGWQNRKHLTMISGNKRSPFTLKRLIGGILSGRFYREFYKERLALIEHFSGKNFDLFGMGWQKPFKGETAALRHAITTAYRGAVDDKFETLKNYRFTLTLENTSAPGYVTEKIFDAIFAGSIPIYLGAPDITDFVPADCFIDLRKFRNYAALEEHLSQITEEEYNKYISAMRRYTTSSLYAPFSQESFAKEVIAIIKKA